MRRPLFAAVTTVCMLGGGLLSAHSAPAAAALDEEITSVQKEIAAAESEEAGYGGGLIKQLIAVRIAMLKNTQAMLTQRRESLAWGINLTYRVDGHSLAPASEEALKDIVADRARMSNKVAKDEAEAQRYSGGLIQAMNLMTAATDRLSLAQLELAYYGNKYGMTLPIEAAKMGSGNEPKKEPPGAVVKDKDAF